MRGFWDRGNLFVLTVIVVAVAYGFLLFNVGPYPAIRQQVPDATLPEERFGYKGADLDAFVSTLVIEKDGAAQTGLNAYKSFQVWDAPNAVLLALALGSAIWVLAAGFGRKLLIRFLVLLPLAMLVFDLSENILISEVIDAWPSVYPGLSALAGTATFLKMIAGSASLGAALLLTILAIAGRFRNREFNAG